MNNMVKNLVVAKFGGTSMGTAASMRGCAEIVKARSDIKIVVVSATSKTTSMLVDLANVSERGDEKAALEIMEMIRARHILMARDLGMNEQGLTQIHQLFEEMHAKSQGMRLLQEAGPRSRDGLYSIGERLSSVLFTFALNKTLPAKLFDVRLVMKTDHHYGKAQVLVDKLKTLCSETFSELETCSEIFVTQGYIGETIDGITTTLGRGGSDYTAALLAEALEARHVEIWTDVSGMYTIDPKITTHAEAIDELSFEEAAEMCTFGAKVLHPATLWPAMRQFIPVFVGNSFSPNSPGTWVRRNSQHSPRVRAISVRDQQKLLTLTSLSMLHAPGFLQTIFSTLARHHISVDLITTSEISVALTLDQPTLLTQEILDELASVAQVSLEDNLTLVAVIGNDLTHTPGLVSSVFATLEDASIRLICHGAGRHNLCFLAESGVAKILAKKLHQRFLENMSVTLDLQ